MSCTTENSYLTPRRSGFQTAYEDSCWYCAIDYSVKFAYQEYRPRYIADVVIDAWHGIGPRKVVQGDLWDWQVTGGWKCWIFERRYDEVCAKWHE